MNINKNQWHRYAIVEGLLKVSHFVIYQNFGTLAKLLQFQLLVTAVIGLVEVIFAGFVAKTKGYAFIPSGRAVFGAIGFGLVAIWLTIIPIYVLAQPGADLAIFGFMTALSVLPGALLDRYVFGDRLRLVHCMGLFLFLFGAWAIQDFPNLTALIELPYWVWLAYTFPLAAAVNEALARFAGMKDMEPAVTTFWVGITQMMVCGGLLVFFLQSLTIVIESLSSIAWMSMMILGFLIWLSHIAKQMAYAPDSGGTIIAKKIVMIGVLMLGLFIYDSFILSLPPTSGEWVGLGSFMVAMLLVYRK